MTPNTLPICVVDPLISLYLLSVVRYCVVNSIGSPYTLPDLISNKHEDVLLHRLHPFRYDQEFLDPKDIAMRDREEYEVQKVLDHQGDPKLKGQMKFLVQWKGYDKNHDSWEPW